MKRGLANVTRNPARTDERGRQSGGIELYEEHPRRRYLSDEEVARLREALAKQSDWVFPAYRKSKTGHMTQPSYRWKLILKAANISEHITIHGIRHSTGAAMIREGVDLYAVGGALGHRSPAITAAVYGHLDLQTKRAALEKSAGRMRLNEVTVTPKPTVTPIFEPPAREAVETEDGALDANADALVRLYGL